jgi:putative ABC transport system substrate-binding protein
MRLVGLAVVLVLGLTFSSLAVAAQQVGKIYKIGVLEPFSALESAANLDALRKGLRELGYVEGQNLVIEYRSADGRNERFIDLAATLARAKVDVIVTRGTPAVLAAKDATGTIPIVMAASGDPLGTGVVASLARPGGNVTGFSGFVRELEAKRVELLKEMVPRIARIAVLVNSSSQLAPGVWKEVEVAARAQGVQAERLDVRRSEDMESAFDTAIRLRVDALLVAQDVIPNRQQIPAFVAQHRLPAMYISRTLVDAGGLISYGVNQLELYRRAATYVDKILKGAKPADLPIEQPTKFELVINMKTAKTLGLTIPQSILLRADQVIE